MRVPGRSTSWVVTCVALVVLLGVLTGSAWAKRIAFVNLARDGAAGQRAIERLRPRITKLARMQAMAKGPARDALEGELDVASENRERIQAAHALLDQARADLKQFDTGAALDKLERAERLLLAVPPETAAVDELYQLELLRGEAHAARGDDASARAAFVRARRWCPQLTSLDPARYRPSLVSLYGAAGVVPPGAGSLRVTSDPAGGTLWLDGVAVGVTPIEINGAVGEHTVAVTLDGHEPRAERVSLVDGKRTDVNMLLSRMPAERRARALRQALISGGAADAAIVAAGRDLADLASVDVLLLVRDGTVGLEAASFDGSTQTLSDWVPADGPAEKVARTIPGVLDPRLVEDPGKDKKLPPPPPPPRPWYRTWWGVSALAGVGVAVLATSAYLIFSDRGTTPDALVITDPEWTE